MNRLVLLATCAALVAAVAGTSARGATGSTVVAATVPSATTISTTGCPTTTANVTDLGTVLAGSKAVTPSNCTVVFGSSNDTARLRIGQQDGAGAAMWALRGELDTTYGGGDGISQTIFDSNVKIQDHVIADDGTAYVIGYDQYSAVKGASVWKFNPAGDLDLGYGGGDGRSEIAVASRYAWDGVLFPDGSVLVAGSTSGATPDAVIVRFDPSGALDLGWGGGDGVSDIIADRGSAWDTWAPADLHQLPSGKLLYVASGSSAGVDGMVAVRFHANGSIDLGYGGGDGISPAVGPSVGATYPNHTGSALLPDGSTIVVGYDTIGGQDTIIAAKFDADGALVNGWGGSGTGIRTIDPDPVASLYSGPAVALADGGIVILTSSEVIDDSWAIKLDATGIPAGGFGASGIARFTSDTFTIISDVEELPDGRLVAMGTDWSTGAGWIDWSVWVLDADGSLDTTYDGDGRSQSVDPDTVDGPGADSRAAGGSIEPDGTIYMSGDSWAGGYVAVARFDSIPVASYSGTADWDTPAPNAATFGACLHSVATGAVASWGATGSCTSVDADPWNAIPATTAGVGSSIATSPSGDADASVNLRFGFRAAPDQAPGRYIAPVSFEVVAPS